jgi:signal transduction histidine kinase
MNPTTASTGSTLLKNGWLILARAVQVLILCLTVGVFIVSIPVNYEQRMRVCEAEPCPPGVLTSESLQVLAGIGLSLDGFVKITIALDILVALVYTGCAVFIFIRKPNDALTIFVTIMLTTFGAATFTGAAGGLTVLQPQLRFIPITLEMIGNCGIIAFLFIFPSGRFTPRWTAALLAVWILFQLPRYYFPASPLNLQNSNPFLYNGLFIGGVLISLASQIYRYRRVSQPIERQQTKWVVYGLAVGVGVYLLTRFLGLTLTDPLGSDLPISLGFFVASIFSMLLVPLSIGVAVLRYRLWAINPIINRTLVYGALSACTMALYVFAVGLFANLFQNVTLNFMVAFIATGVIAIIFEPLRERFQRSVNRIMYGERDDPATVLARLSQRLDSSLAVDSTLPTIVETVAQALRLPYAAISLYSSSGEPRIVAEVGLRPTDLIRLPLAYQSNRVGELLLAPRARDESLSMADTRLLNIIAQQAGVAAHTVQLAEELRQLNADLQHSRQRLVTAQEEERRRLRRDLHDGVGPTLASLTLRLDAAADLAAQDPQASVNMLKELKGQVKGALAEIRRLVYNLRPPVLDEFGLVSAIREHIAPYTGPNGMQILYDVTEPMPPLPAAVEVAAYRIILAAFTNVVQHAQAQSCRIEIKVDGDWLSLQIEDDGQGISSSARSGVGLASMRERAAELGGEFGIEKKPTGGTGVRARLPLLKE